MGPGLEQLRETLHVTPRGSLWAEVTAWFDRHGDGPDATVASTYARTHLASLTRPAPSHWVADALGGRRPSGWELANLVSLRGHRMLPDQLQKLLGAGWLADVESLDLGDTGLGQAGLSLICGVDGPGNLTHLDMGNSRRSSQELTDATALLDAPFARRLEVLHLANNRLGPACTASLRRGPLRLRSLNLSGNGLGPTGVANLAESGFLSRMDALTVSNTGAGDLGVQAILHARSSYTTLKLSTNGLTHRAFDRPLATRNLAVGDNALGLAGLQSLLAALERPPTRLALWACQLTSEAVAQLAASEAFGVVERLELGWNRLGEAGIRALASGRTPGRLRALDLRSNKAGDEGLAALAEMEMPLLESLSLRRWRLTDAAVDNLLRAPWVSGLRTLNLEKNRLSPDGVRRLGALRDFGVSVSVD